jgi:hypothetical protein
MPRGIHPRRFNNLPQDKDLPLDLKGYPNRSYLGHESFLPTPWPLEGKEMQRNEPRRFPLSKDVTKEIRAEIRRLAAIENPGLCRARQKRYDAWCKKLPQKGCPHCIFHGGGRKTAKIEEAKRNERARAIINSAMK